MVSATTGQTSLQGAVAGREGENHLAKNATQFFQQKTQKHTPKFYAQATIAQKITFKYRVFFLTGTPLKS